MPQVYSQSRAAAADPGTFHVTLRLGRFCFPYSLVSLSAFLFDPFFAFSSPRHAKSRPMSEMVTGGMGGVSRTESLPVSEK